MRETSPEKHGEFRIINLSVKLYPPLEMSSNLIWTDNKRRSSDQTVDGEDCKRTSCCLMIEELNFNLEPVMFSREVGWNFHRCLC